MPFSIIKVKNVNLSKLEKIMNTVIIRQKLHNYLEVVDDKKVKALYAIMENDIEQSIMQFTEEMKNELDNRYADYKSGKAKTVTALESRIRVQEIIKSANKK